MYKSIAYFFIILTLQLSLGCSSNNQELGKIKANNQLYHAIGAQEGINSLVDALIKRIAQDKEILPYFAKSSVTHFKEGFTNHLCAVTNGPCEYNGDTMYDIHTGMHINEKDFNRVVELLIQAMEDVNISYQSQNKILLKLAPLREQIIKI